MLILFYFRFSVWCLCRLEGLGRRQREEGQEVNFDFIGNSSIIILQAGRQQ